MPYCPECGNEVEEDQEYCDECGQQLDSLNDEKPSDGSSESSEDIEGSDGSALQAAKENPLMIVILMALPFLLIVFVSNTMGPAANDGGFDPQDSGDDSTDQNQYPGESEPDSGTVNEDRPESSDDTGTDSEAESGDTGKAIQISEIYSTRRLAEHDQLTEISDRTFRVPERQIYTYIISDLTFSESVQDVRQSVNCESTTESGEAIGAWNQDESSDKFTRYSHEPLIDWNDFHLQSQFTVQSEDKFTFRTYDDYGPTIVEGSGESARLSTVVFISNSTANRFEETVCDIRITTGGGHSVEDSFTLSYE